MDVTTSPSILSSSPSQTTHETLAFLHNPTAQAAIAFFWSALTVMGVIGNSMRRGAGRPNYLDRVNFNYH